MRDFFDTLFGGEPTGNRFLCIGRISGERGRGVDIRTYYRWPAEADAAVEECERYAAEDVYYSPVLYNEPRATKQNAGWASGVWVDADTAAPDTFKLAPTISLRTSPNRWQCLWLFDGDIEVDWAESMSRNVTYSNLEAGSDKGGWSRAKLLRVPGTTNTKPEYGPDFPTVEYEVDGAFYSVEEMEARFGVAMPLLEVGEVPLPDDLPEKVDILAKLPMNPDITRMLNTRPLHNWSDTLYALECALFREGLTAPEVFVVVRGCECDKYTRDRRPETDLWKEILRCEQDPTLLIPQEASVGPRPLIAPTPAPLPRFVSAPEREQIATNFIDDYTTWAQSKTLAYKGYHQFSALSLMATVLGDFGHAVPQFGNMGLNLFVMILGETTRTYKTTSKNLMLQVLRPLEADGYEYEVPGDATTEGLLVDLAERPQRSNLFVRDEVQQMFADSKGGKSWLGGLATTFTELYDGWVRGRLRSTGVKKAPSVQTCFSMYTMGVPDRVAQVLNPEDFASGFLARFIYVIGTPAPKTRETERLEQAPEIKSNTNDDVLIGLQTKLGRVRHYWASKTPPGETIAIRCDEQTWERYNDYIYDVTDRAEAEDRPELVGPSSNRMTKTVLKVATLLAMMDCSETVQMGHMLTAIAYSESWYMTLVQVASMISSSEWMAKMEQLMAWVVERGRVKWSVAYKRSGMRPREFEDLVVAATSAEMVKWTIDRDTKEKWLEPYL